MDFFGHSIGHGDHGDADHDDRVYDLARDSRAVPAPADQDHGYRPSVEPAGMHVTGTQLRRRLVTPEEVAAIHAEEPKKSLVQALLGRVRKRG